MKQKKQSKNYNAPALDKGLDILELLSNSNGGLTQAEIATQLNKSVNEIYRMISTLRNREYVEFNEKTDIYNLSYKILNMAAKFEPVKTLTSRAIPLMKEITIKTNQSIHLAIFTRGKILLIAQEDSPSSFNYHMSVGANIDALETSSGRVLLTFQTEEERNRMLDRRKFYIKLDKNHNLKSSNLKKIENKFSKRTMQKIFKDRFEVVKSLQIKGVTNITVPILDNTNNAVAALTIPFVDRIIKDNELNIKQVTNIIVSYGKKLSFDMGYRGQ
ncbi:IclR family transcriptional regulator [Alphaproteobacteria bacterium]|nr:IclR family transcriptional regulator [Alphaproteobacteria bacterium]